MKNVTKNLNENTRFRKNRNSLKAVLNRKDNKKPERIAKRMARAGLCSRREAEKWILAGRVSVNGHLLDTPALTVTCTDCIRVDGRPLPDCEPARLWLYHKPAGVLSTNHDPEGRPILFDQLPKELPRLMSVGRLDMNTQGLLLMTNHGGLARMLELPSTGWLRRYRVRVYGSVDRGKLAIVENGITVDGISYGSIKAVFERQQGSNAWLTVSMREGKNREVKKALGAIGLMVNRLIRISYGPFRLDDLETGQIREVPARIVRDQSGGHLLEAAEANPDLSMSIYHQIESAQRIILTKKSGKQKILKQANTGSQIRAEGGKKIRVNPK